jgi:hypothetical protein
MLSIPGEGETEAKCDIVGRGAERSVAGRSGPTESLGTDRAECGRAKGPQTESDVLAIVRAGSRSGLTEALTLDPRASREKK